MCVSVTGSTGFYPITPSVPSDQNTNSKTRWPAIWGALSLSDSDSEESPPSRQTVSNTDIVLWPFATLNARFGH